MNRSTNNPRFPLFTWSNNWLRHICMVHLAIRARIGDRAQLVYERHILPVLSPGENYERSGDSLDLSIPAWVISTAAMCDTTVRTKDWYLELVIVFSITINKVSRVKGTQLPSVTHVLWTKEDGLILGVSTPTADNANPTGAASSIHHVHALGSTPPSTTIRLFNPVVIFFFCVLLRQDGQQAKKDVYGLVFKLLVLRNFSQQVNAIFQRPEYSRIEALNFLHVKGFKLACGNPRGSRRTNKGCDQSA
ncbi:hypothetical protein M407DRAFT_12506 [Tulasnella calospora MUT 4182]|uniref:Uncharacterized protein n=1 Tax=Tulasnella calospora MUT 4182 TaxID=1051891 RepID=A0A0C3PR29_9AGAM|nr:hypothetical protein M407DRAFT_12506 [Tulasnella calospora MUT 4182]